MTFWESDWRRITAKSFTEHIVPVIDNEIHIHTELIFQEDNTPVHSAKYTQAEFVRRGISVMRWPASSPDLNPKTIWQRIKQPIQSCKHFPRTLPDLQAVIQEEWDRNSEVEVREIIDTMPEQVRAVIEAKEGRSGTRLN